MALAASVGVIGLGIIGSRVAARLVGAGFNLAVWNRTPRAFEGLPSLSRDPAAVAEKAAVLQVFVADDAALREVMATMLPALGPRHVVLNHATVAPQTVRELAGTCAERGTAFLDAPFTGSRDAAAKGLITYYIGGEAPALERARPVLEASARSIIQVGAVGTASAVKIATNIMAAAAAVSLAEAVSLLRANGVNPAVLPAVLENNAARSGVTDLKLSCMLQEDFAPRFSAKNMLKDLRLARAAADPDHHELIEAMRRLYESVCREGNGDEDFAAVIKARQAAH